MLCECNILLNTMLSVQKFPIRSSLEVNMDLRWSYCSESLLASCIPDLQFNFLSIYVNCSDFEVYSNCSDIWTFTCKKNIIWAFSALDVILNVEVVKQEREFWDVSCQHYQLGNWFTLTFFTFCWVEDTNKKSLSPKFQSSGWSGFQVLACENGKILKILYIQTSPKFS